MSQGELLVVGRTGVDLYGPKGIHADFRAGEKRDDWGPEHEDIFNGSREGFDQWPGQGGLNTAVRSAHLGHRVHLLSGVSTDRDGRMLKEHAESLGVNPEHIRDIDGFETPAGIVRRNPQGSREITVRPSSSLEAAWTPDDVSKTAKGFGAIAVNSTKSMPLTWAVARGAEDGAYLALTPSRNDTPDDVAALLEARPFDLLAVNEDELRGLFGHMRDGDMDPRELAELVSETYGVAVQCTRGPKGSLLARDGGSVEHGIVGNGHSDDESGAGDAFFAHTIDGGRRNQNPVETLRQGAESTYEVVNHTGPHGDLMQGPLGKVAITGVT